METYRVNNEGYYGEFGGAYIPEILHRCVEELRQAYLQVLDNADFQQEFNALLRDYVGRPSPLYLAQRFSRKYGCRIYLKREDPSARCCWPGAWASGVSSPRRAPDSMAWPRPPSAP